ncbi:MAG: PP2C family protein-serine/threonine phosphatase [Anaerolineae bacterium]
MRPNGRTIQSRLLPVARVFWPGLDEAGSGDLESSSRLADVLGFLYGAPIALIALGWLIAVTDLSLLLHHWWVVSLFLALVVLLRQLMFVVFIEIRSGDYADFRGSLVGIVSWSAALSFGPTALWVSVAGALSYYLVRSLGSDHRPISMPTRWNHARNLTLELTEVTAGLVGLVVYQRLGGTLPLSDVQVVAFMPAGLATATRFALSQLFLSPLLLYWRGLLNERTEAHDFGRYVGITAGLPLLIDSFAILAAALYAGLGLGIYLFFAGGVVLVGLLTNRLSRAAIRSRQRARELERLERLGRDIIQTPVDPSSLSGVLSEHIPGMFPNFQIEVRLFPDQVIYQHPDGPSLLPGVAWDWLRSMSQAHCLLPGEPFPWDEGPSVHERLDEPALIAAPILEPDGADPIGGVVLAQQARDAWGGDEIASSVPAIQTLASQIGSALHGAELYRMEQELSLAGQIQASFLPQELPQIPGWHVAAALEPARQTAGDFYDVIPLPNGRFGLVVADVAGKGMGAALYMALARTLLRTYALEYHGRPDFAMKVTNRRILMDTDVTMFVTVFYGILDPRTGKLAYCNAGHNPPYLLRAGSDSQLERLTKTGMALGAMLGTSWEQRVVRMVAGDTLVLYSDGLTDVQNERGVFFGERRLQRAVRASAGRPAHHIQRALLQAAHGFGGEAARFDDITLMIVVRDIPDR